MGTGGSVQTARDQAAYRHGKKMKLSSCNREKDSRCALCSSDSASTIDTAVPTSSLALASPVSSACLSTTSLSTSRSTGSVEKCRHQGKKIAPLTEENLAIFSTRLATSQTTEQSSLQRYRESHESTQERTVMQTNSHRGRNVQRRMKSGERFAAKQKKEWRSVDDKKLGRSRLSRSLPSLDRSIAGSFSSSGEKKTDFSQRLSIGNEARTVGGSDTLAPWNSRGSGPFIAQGNHKGRLDADFDNREQFPAKSSDVTGLRPKRLSALHRGSTGSMATLDTTQSISGKDRVAQSCLSSLTIGDLVQCDRATATVVGVSSIPGLVKIEYTFTKVVQTVREHDLMKIKRKKTIPPLVKPAEALIQPFEQEV